MSLFSFYREAEPSDDEDFLVQEEQDEDEELLDSDADSDSDAGFGANWLPMDLVKEATFFDCTPDHQEQRATALATPDSLVSRFDDDDDDGDDEDEADADVDAGSGSRRRRRQRRPPPPTRTVAMPVELWEIIFGFVVPDANRDTYISLHDLFNCALTCRSWSLIALPLLYRSHGFGVLMPKSDTRDAICRYFPVSRSIDLYNSTGSQRMLQLWRTLLLSCFTASRPTTPSRFTTFRGATLFPYIKYVASLDARTLVLVLTEIMKSQRVTGTTALDPGAAEFFFSGALGAFEISGEARGERMVVGGPEYAVQCPVGGKEVKIFVGDTALMIMDFLYPHIHHVKGFTIPELGQLRVHAPITMSHPVGLLTSLTNLTSLVISSGWMVSAGLGKAIARIRPSLYETAQSRRHVVVPDFSLTIVDWRFKTHYDPHYHHREDWETDHEDYRTTIRSACDFFNCLNANSVTALDIDFEVRYSRQQINRDLGDGAVALRQSRSLKALRIAHVRTTHAKLANKFRHMAVAGFMPRALSLYELYTEAEPTGGVAGAGTGGGAGAGAGARERWLFPPSLFAQLEALDLTRFSGMFEFAAGALVRHPAMRALHLAPLAVLRLSYNRRFFDEAGEAFLLHTVPALAPTLTALRLDDTDGVWPVQPPAAESRRARTEYGALPESPLEALTRLRSLVLVGDVAAFLLAGRLPHVLDAMKRTLTTVDLCLPPRTIVSDDFLTTHFLRCGKLESLVLRAWEEPGAGRRSPAYVYHLPYAGDLRDVLPLTVNTTGGPPSPLSPGPPFGLSPEAIAGYLSRTRAVLVPLAKPGRMVLRQFGISEDLCKKRRPKWRDELALVRQWMKDRGGTLWLGDEEIPAPL